MVEGSLRGQTAAISGGMGDIGRAIAEELAGRGANVALGDVRGGEAADEFLRYLAGRGARCRFDEADTADPQAVARWLDAVEADLGPVTLAIPNAAIVTLSRALTITPEDWERHLRINLTGAFLFAQEAARRMVQAARPGRIVFVGSWAGHAPNLSIIPYCVSKAGLRMLMRSLALELAPHDILVNEVAPGYVDAGVSAQVFREEPGRREAAQAHVPTQRMIAASEVALQVAHLCDPRNRHQAGAVQLMDGGLSLLAGRSTDG